MRRSKTVPSTVCPACGKTVAGNSPSRLSGVELVCFLTMIFMISLWAVDVSASAMAAEVEVVSLFGVFDPHFTYHLGLVMAVVSFASLALIAAHHIGRGCRA